MLLNTKSADKWKRIGLQKRAGILISLFSVYSKNSLGIGDFLDLKLLVDFASLTGNSIIQLLPLNEVGALFCPYDSLSSFALEPAYIHLDSPQKTRNPTYPYLDYKIKEEKLNILLQSFTSDKERDSGNFSLFRKENSYWLPEFSLYKALKAHHNGSAWYEWEDKFKFRDKSALEVFKNEHSKELEFQEWVQWKLFKQLRAARIYANSKNIFLKGDLPILVSRDSADVWSHPKFFKLDFAAGAPVDMYCAKGQRWGMPTYNWDKIKEDGFRYLAEKLRYAQNFYDILRVDHVVGLFRIWSIPYNEPLENKGLNGLFDPGDEGVWGIHGRTILETMLNNTSMLLCAEDLGLIPRVCTDTLKDLGIPGNDVQRWVKDWKVAYDFLSPSGYRKLSVSMLSTHDTTNWPAWWENEVGTIDEDLFYRRCMERGINFNKVKPKLFDLNLSKHGRLRWLNPIDLIDKLVWNLDKKKEEVGDFIDLYLNSFREKEKLWKQMGLKGKMREKCDKEIVKAALKITLDSASIFSINTLIDWLYTANIFKGDPYDNRLNTPGTISDKNWSLTLPISLEKLLEHKVVKEMKKMAKDSGRV
ncbi:MAG: 4-alpha-glucanotransferase [Candidatus Omnitrophota bacterium]|jgi:4-alpha-glucanotransferase